MSNLIEAEGLIKSFGRVKALDGLDLGVGKGQIHGFLGPNGAGKSTTIRVLLGMYHTDGGRARVLGMDPAREASAINRRLAYVPGSVSLWPSLTGGQVLDTLAGLRGSRDRAREEELTERFDLDPTKKVRTYSKGNAQKVALVAALAAPTRLLVLDEPTSGLDPLMQHEFLNLIREAQNNGQTVLLSSHILGEIQHTADAAAVLAHGTIVAEGDIASLRITGASRLRTVITGTDARSLRSQLEKHPELTELEVREIGQSMVQVSGLLRGEPDSLIKTLSHYTIHDLTLEEPDLEESVLELYESTVTPS